MRLARRSAEDGFTLVELLWVIGLVSLLVGLVVPGLAKGRAAARGLGCLGNLRQWGSGTLDYAHDHGDRLPDDGAGNGTSLRDAWYADVPPYLGEAPYARQGPWRTNSIGALPRCVWLCPANPRRSDGHMLFHYCLNRLVNGSGSASQPVVWSSLQEPSRTVWLFDNGKRAAVATAGNVHPGLHPTGVNMLFLDGHATRVPRKFYWDPVRERPIMDHPELRWTGRNLPAEPESPN